MVADLAGRALAPGRPALRHVFAPPGHQRALQPKVSLVVGTRGAGKTFWTQALIDPEVRALLQHTASVDLSGVTVDVGHAEAPHRSHYPDGELFTDLLRRFEPLHVWRAVAARWMSRMVDEDVVSVPMAAWPETVEWVAQHPEAYARLAEKANDDNARRGRTSVLVFDALDRVSSEWTTRAKVTRALLQLLLQLRSFTHLHGKAFVRDDELSRSEVTSFPDASKLLAERADLTWTALDLHGLLWQHLLNVEGTFGEVLREQHAEVLGRPPERVEDDVWTLARRDRSSESALRVLFEALAGMWMGNDRRRGATFPWIVAHLADSMGRTSPRSFLRAIGVAAEQTYERYPDHDRPLHVEAIKAGVQAASRGRVDELLEDHPWARDPMHRLEGLTVPCTFDDVATRWVAAMGAQLPPAIATALPTDEVHQGWGGVRQALERIGVFERLRDGRVNLPDLYRVGLSIGRKGGVRPVAARG